MNCQACAGTGEVDTGGSTPWGAWITDACPYCEGRGTVSYMHYWISWYQPGDDPRPLTFPPNEAILGWWNSGWGDSCATLCALVRGESESDAKAGVLKDWPEAKVWRFCEEKSHDWRPGDRFVVDKDWMKQRLA